MKDISNKKKRAKTLALSLISLLLIMPLLGRINASPGYGLASEAELSVDGDGTAEWSESTAKSSDWSIHLKAPDKASWDSVNERGVGVNEGRISITLDDGTTLGDIDNVTWWVNTVSGYPPHVDLLLDIDGDGDHDSKKDLVTGEIKSGPDDAMVAEFAYQPHVDTGYKYISPRDPYGHYDATKLGSYYEPIYNVWVETFQKTALELRTNQLNDSAVCWLYSGHARPYSGGYFGELIDFKDGIVQIIDGNDIAPVDKDTKVLSIQIEVDNWLGAAEAYIDDIVINDELLISNPHPTVSLVYPESINYIPGDVPVEILASDLFGITEVLYNVKNSEDDRLYSTNKTYTGPTSMEDVPVGMYTFQAWATNELGYITAVKRTFSVRVTEPTAVIHPRTINLKSRGRWVTVVVLIPPEYNTDENDVDSVALEFNGKTVNSEWGVITEGKIMVKFDRDKLQKILEEGEEVEIEILGEAGEVLFQDSDTIRVINPGKVSRGYGYQKHSDLEKYWQRNRGNTGKPPKKYKGGKNN